MECGAWSGWKEQGVLRQWVLDGFADFREETAKAGAGRGGGGDSATWCNSAKIIDSNNAFITFI